MIQETILKFHAIARVYETVDAEAVIKVPVKLCALSPSATASAWERVIVNSAIHG